MGHDNHHHVDDLSGFSLFRLIWPAALLLMVVLVTRNCCGGCCEDKCCGKTECKKEMTAPAHGEEAAHGEHH